MAGSAIKTPNIGSNTSPPTALPPPPRTARFNLLVAEEADCRDQEIERVHREAKGHLANAAATLRCLRVFLTWA